MFTTTSLSRVLRESAPTSAASVVTPVVPTLPPPTRAACTLASKDCNPPPPAATSAPPTQQPPATPSQARPQHPRLFHCSFLDSTAKNASCGTDTFPTTFILFLPSACFFSLQSRKSARSRATPPLQLATIRHGICLSARSAHASLLTMPNVQLLLSAGIPAIALRRHICPSNTPACHHTVTHTQTYTS